MTRKIETMKTETLLRQLAEINAELSSRYYTQLWDEQTEDVDPKLKSAVLGPDSLLNNRTTADRHLGRLLRSIDLMVADVTGDDETADAARSDLRDIEGSACQLDEYLREHDERFGTQIVRPPSPFDPAPEGE